MLLAGADRSFNAMVIGGALFKLVRYGWSMADCEGMLRELESNTYLVAWHRSKMPGYMKLRNPYGGACEYAVWICLFGRQERDENLRGFDIAGIEENLDHLKKAGFVSAAP